MWKDLSMTVRLIHTSVFTFIFAAGVSETISVSNSLFFTVGAMLLFMSFVNEFVIVQMLVNQVKIKHMRLVPLGSYLIGALTAGIMLKFMSTFASSEAHNESAWSFRYLLTGYVWGAGMFIASATRWRTLE